MPRAYDIVLRSLVALALLLAPLYGAAAVSPCPHHALAQAPTAFFAASDYAAAGTADPAPPAKILAAGPAPACTAHGCTVPCDAWCAPVPALISAPVAAPLLPHAGRPQAGRASAHVSVAAAPDPRPPKPRLV